MFCIIYYMGIFIMHHKLTNIKLQHDPIFIRQKHQNQDIYIYLYMYTYVYYGYVEMCIWR